MAKPTTEMRAHTHTHTHTHTRVMQTKQLATRINLGLLAITNESLQHIKFEPHVLETNVNIR